MQVVNVIGGLGNQMFQCAFAIALSKINNNQEVKIDISHFNGYGLHNGFEISRVFPKYRIPIANKKELKKLTLYVPNYKWSRIVRRLLPKKITEYLQPYQESYVYKFTPFEIKDDMYFEGYWMCPAYFDFCKKDIIDAYSFREFDSEENKKWSALLASKDSVTIHVRRGDYVGAESFKNICTLCYYRKAISEAKVTIKDPVFFVFSNDQEWCKSNLKDEFGDSVVHYVSNNKGQESYRDMQLMSLARCNILANSSFSWWGAYLNQRSDHIVFCPSKWVNNFEHTDHYVDNWHKIQIV